MFWSTFGLFSSCSLVIFELLGPDFAVFKAFWIFWNPFCACGPVVALGKNFAFLATHSAFVQIFRFEAPNLTMLLDKFSVFCAFGAKSEIAALFFIALCRYFSVVSNFVL